MIYHNIPLDSKSYVYLRRCNMYSPQAPCTIKIDDVMMCYFMYIELSYNFRYLLRFDRDVVSPPLQNFGQYL